MFVAAPLLRRATISAFSTVPRRAGLPVFPAPLAAAAPLRFHCQVPCGIFTDDLRVKGMIEDAATIRKAMVQSAELHKAGSIQDMHQMVRWIHTKEEHAQKIMTTVGDYFMAQKVKKADLKKEEYVELLCMLHDVMVAAMKTKQTTDVAAADTLEAALKVLEPTYVK